MPISRFLLSSSKRHLTEHLQRFDPSKRIQSCSYAKSSRNGYRKPESPRVISVESQSSWAAYAIPGALLGFAGLAAIFHFNDERRAIPKGDGNCSSRTCVKGPVIGGPFTLTNTENQTITERDFLGKWVLLYFGYTSSPDVGPEQLQIMAKTIDKLESKHNAKVLPVFVTIDPQRDTIEQLRAYLRGFDSRIVGLTGQASAVRQMAQEFRVFFKKIEEGDGDYLVESSHNMYLMSPKMEVVRCFGIEYNVDELCQAILNELERTQN